jgi:hypothetical protein
VVEVVALGCASWTLHGSGPEVQEHCCERAYQHRPEAVVL